MDDTNTIKELDIKEAASEDTTCPLTSALQQGFGLQVHLRGVSLGGVDGAQGARVGVVSQRLLGGVAEAVQRLRAGRHFLPLWRSDWLNISCGSL